MSHHIDAVICVGLNSSSKKKEDGWTILFLIFVMRNFESFYVKYAVI